MIGKWIKVGRYQWGVKYYGDLGSNYLKTILLEAVISLYKTKTPTVTRN